jgi:hypothetical protein
MTPQTRSEYLRATLDAYDAVIADLQREVDWWRGQDYSSEYNQGRLQSLKVVLASVRGRRTVVHRMLQVARLAE